MSSLRFQKSIRGVDEANEYWEQSDANLILESILTGLAYERPPDALSYIEECIAKIRNKDFPSKSKDLQWDSFIRLPPPTDIMSIFEDKTKKPQKKHPSSSKVADINGSSFKMGSTNSVLTAKTSKFTNPKAWANIVFVLGKGTQCEKIAKEFHYIHISIGDLLRKEVESGSEIGEMIDELIREGKIVPVEHTLKILKTAMESFSSGEGFLIDGFPRKLDQAEAFEKNIGSCKFVLYFECKEEELEKRLIRRGDTSGRIDDNIESITKILETFLKVTYPVIEMYKNKDKCITIPSDRSIDDVYTSVKYHFQTHGNHKNIISVLGGPGSGKGTICEKIAKEFQLVHISIGDLLRNEVIHGTQIGKQAAELIKQGRMVSPSVVFGLIKDEIDRNMSANGILLDGFPATMEQAAEFENAIGVCKSVIYLNCSIETLKKRSLQRGKTSGRDDDNAVTIDKRLQIFVDYGLPVVKFFKKKGKVIEISGESPIPVVYDQAKKYFVPPKPIFMPADIKHLNLSNIIFVLGGPGSGKGTQCARLAKEHKFLHISTGDLLRNEVEQKTEIGKTAAQIMEKGGMVPMSMILQLLTMTLKKNSSDAGYLIDGFPRTMDQVIEFEKAIGKPKFVLYFKCPLETLENRLLERGKTSGRADDKLETIRLRFKTYENESLPVVHYYSGKNVLVEIDSTKSVDEVYESVLSHFAPRPFDGSKIIFVLGGPGSGKGTQCDKIKELGYAHISTGDLLRDEIKRGTPLGNQLEVDMKEGKMISLDITLSLLKNKMLENKDAAGFLIDGFPRTMEQALVFEKTIGSCSFVLYFDASHETLTKRLISRGLSSGRADDNEESIKKRLVTFTNSSLPVIKHFEQDNRVRKINAEGSIDEITKSTMACFK